MLATKLLDLAWEITFKVIGKLTEWSEALDAKEREQSVDEFLNEFLEENHELLARLEDNKPLDTDEGPR